MVKRVILLGLSALVCAVVAIPALGQGTAAPKPCAGVAAADPKGDHQATAQTSSAGDNQDVTSLYFRTDKTTTAYIQVVNLSKTLPADPSVDSISWFAYWDDAEGANRFVSASVGADGAPVYEYGTRSDTNTLTIDGTTKGQFFEGPDGVVAISLPGAVAKAGTTLAAPVAQASINRLIGAAGTGLRLFSAADVAPDTGGGKDYKIVDCAGGTDATPPPTTPGPGSGPTGPVTAPHSLTLVSKSAKGAKKKAVTIQVRSSGPVKNFTATLKKGAKALATGTLAEFNGTVKVKLKAKKKLKKGSYTVQLVARNDDGQESRGSGKLKVK
jgi:hypothetical protein